MKDQIKFKGRVKLVARDKNGKVIGRRTVENLFLNQGRAFIAKVLARTLGNDLSYIVVGTSGTVPAVTDVTLFGFESQATGALSTVTTTVANDTYKIVATIPITLSATLQEAGIAYKLTPLLITNRVTYASLIMPANSALTVTWTLQVL